MATLLVPTYAAYGQDSDATRFYLQFRLGTQFAPDASVADGISASQFQDVHGLSVGANLGRHFGVEIAVDQWEPNLRRAHALGEYGIATVIPQVRARYPLLGGRLTPYLLGGVGVAFSEFNDRKADAFGQSVGGSDVGVAGAVGGGFEYFVANNVAVGIESKAIVGAPHDFKLDGGSRNVTIDSVLTSASLRIFVADAAAGSLSESDTMDGPRGHLDIRAGVARPLDRRVSRDLDLRPEGAAIGTWSQLIGFAVGVDLSPRWGVALSAEGFEHVLAVRGLGSVSEYAIYVVMPQVRLRHPLASGLVPYVMAGVGASYAEANDTKPRARIVKVEGSGFGVAGEAGVGVDYFIARNIALGLEAKYLYSRDQVLEVAGDRQTLNLDSLLGTIGIRLVFP